MYKKQFSLNFILYIEQILYFLCTTFLLPCKLSSSYVHTILGWPVYISVVSIKHDWSLYLITFIPKGSGHACDFSEKRRVLEGLSFLKKRNESGSKSFYCYLWILDPYFTILCVYEHECGVSVIFTLVQQTGMRFCVVIILVDV